MLLNPLCACVLLVYIPLAKASHMVKPKVRVGGLYSHWQRVQLDWVGVENWRQFFKHLHHENDYLSPIFFKDQKMPTYICISRTEKYCVL